MKKFLAIFLISLFSIQNVNAVSNFSSFLEDHNIVQARVAKIASRITVNKNLLEGENAPLRKLRKQLRNINRKHNRIQKRLSSKFKIDKSNLKSIKTHQKAMSFNRNDLQNNLRNSYALAEANNELLEMLIEDNKAKAFTDSTNSGVYGSVSMITGDCMPKIITKGEKPKQTCFEEAFPTTVIIRNKIHISEMDKFVKYNGSKEPLFILETNDQGSFSLDLAAGEYSIFILDENNNEYCNFYDGEGFACTITVHENMHSEYNLNLDRAAY
jgi:hypothetical protein